jgi:hypothetical protein
VPGCGKLRVATGLRFSDSSEPLDRVGRSRIDRLAAQIMPQVDGQGPPAGVRPPPILLQALQTIGKPARFWPGKSRDGSNSMRKHGRRAPCPCRSSQS